MHASRGIEQNGQYSAIGSTYMYSYSYSVVIIGRRSDQEYIIIMIYSRS
jgi:hypothetical protein